MAVCSLMARIRSVHPDICTDEVLARLSGDVERCYVRLWTHLDDEGRAVDNPLLIKAALFPLVETISTSDVDGWLARLADAGLVRRYEVDGRRYLTAKPDAWARWQKPRRKVDSKLPEPPCADNVGTPPDNGPQCPTGGGDVGGGEMEMDEEKEGESEGEPQQPSQDDTPCGQHGAPANLHEKLERLKLVHSEHYQVSAPPPGEAPACLTDAVTGLDAPASPLATPQAAGRSDRSAS